MMSQLYYAVKPLIPRPLRTFIKRVRAYSKLAACSDIWPIDERAGATPVNWPGWPEGKRFAVVLTHDVEGTKGLHRVEQLKKLEEGLGFRSSFNFVLEGEYRVSDGMRQVLTEGGFEVGIHGLKHDGKLYNSKKIFAERARRIREYLDRWNAVGFRSPLMHHKLSWIHELGVEYDSSTFDTDPFEPQPDAIRTIFPFWVAAQNGQGYVELPYTLPQDFTLFGVLREQNNDVWKRKLDWIAARGGMALLNTHPDYMCFDGRRGRDEFPVTHYEEFLRYIGQQYQGEFWHALPRDVSRFYTSSLPLPSRNTRKKVCMVAYSFYESDNRVRRYAETLVKRGDLVDVIALAWKDRPLGEGLVNGVRVMRIQERKYNEKGMLTYAWPLLRFLFAAAILLARQHKKERYDLIHVHNMPDFLVWTAWYPKWTDSKVILDIHDIVPELFLDKFKVGSDSWYVRLLKCIEKKSSAFADHVIISNHLWHDKLMSRSVPQGKSSVFINHVDEGVFYQRKRTRVDRKCIILFPGSFQWHQGLDIAIEALGHLKESLPDAELHLYGGGGASIEGDLARLAKQVGVGDRVKFCGGVPLDQIPQVIANADLGVVPKRADSFGNEAYSTKIMEFMSQGIPVVVSRTAIDKFYYDDTVVRFFESGNPKAMAEAMLEIIENSLLREAMVANAYEYVVRHSWGVKKKDYLSLVDSLTVERFGV